MAAFALAYAGVALALADLRIMPGLDMDRYAFMESLVERGRFWVDESKMLSVDRIRIGEHYYSGKPPVLNFIGAGVYWILHHGVGWSFRTHADQVVRVMIAMFVSVPLALLFFGFWRVASRPVHNVSPEVEDAKDNRRLRSAAIATLLLGFASLLPPYTRVFSNHPLAAALLFGAFILVLDDQSRRPLARGIAFGFVAGLSATIDLLPGTFFLLCYGCIMMWRLARGDRSVVPGLSGAIIGALVPTIAHFVLNRLTMGTWVTSYFVKDAFNYPGSVWAADFASDDYAQFPTFWSGLYHYTLGHRSSLMLMPLLAYGVYHAARTAAARTSRQGQRIAAMCAIVSLVALLVLVPAFSMGLAGGTYGNRHLLPVIAVLYIYLPLEMLSPRKWMARFGFALLSVWSVAVGMLGTLMPWSPYTISAYAPLDVLGATLARRGESPTAEWIVQHTAPKPAFGYQELGYHQWQGGHRAEALESYLTAFVIQPTRTQAAFAAGILAGELGKSELAVQMFRKVVEIEKTNAGGWANLGVTYLDMGNNKEAFSALKQALDLNPKSHAALYGIMRYHAARGEKQQAREFAQRLLAEEPGNPYAKTVLADGN